jgi:hypothetical protein
MRRLLGVAVGYALLFGAGHAQDYQRIAPKAVPPVAPAKPLPSPSAPVAEADDDVLLPKLKGLVFVAKPGDVVKNGVHTKGVAITDVALRAIPRASPPWPVDTSAKN